MHETKKVILQRMTDMILNSKNQFVVTECSRIALAVLGVPVSQGLTAEQAQGKITAQLVMARKEVVDKLEKQRERKRLQNKRHNLRKALKGADASEQAALQQELAKLAKLENKPQAQVQAEGSILDIIDETDPRLVDLSIFPITPEEARETLPRGMTLEEFICDKRKSDAVIRKMLHWINNE